MSVFLNGEFVPLAEARISPLDRGFLFGDGVYEVIPAYAGKLFRCDQHLDRLENSLDGIRLHNPYSRSQWKEILNELLQMQPYDNHSIYLQVTRGADQKREHSFPRNIQPTVFIMSTELNTGEVAIQHEGVCAITREDNRWQHCDIKAITLLANILLRQEATDENCSETILTKDGQVIEAVEERITVHELFAADEVWLTSSTKEILPVTHIDGKAIGKGKPGPVWQQMISLYANHKKRLVAGEIT